MKAYAYIDYSPIKILTVKDQKTTAGLTGDFREIDTDDLPDKSLRNFWKWDSLKNKVVVDKAKVKAIKDKKEADDALLAGIKTKLGLTDDEWEVLKGLVRK